MSEEFTFDTKEELINYLHKMLKKLNKMDEFMVFLVYKVKVNLQHY